jgi:hypothetical protein
LGFLECNFVVAQLNEILRILEQSHKERRIRFFSKENLIQSHIESLALYVLSLFLTSRTLPNNFPLVSTESDSAMPIVKIIRIL